MKIGIVHRCAGSLLLLLASCLFLLTGCGGGGGNDNTRPPGTADFVVLVGRAPSQPDERFVVRLVTPEQITAARAMISGQRPRQIVFGSLADGSGGFNRDPVSGRSWSWHLVPGSVTFVDVTAEIYDGAPSGVERDKAEYLRLGRYGPWGSRVERELP
jgi:hypothetical protein